MTAMGLVEEKLSGSAIGAFFEVYDALGYGFLEHVYKAALERELRTRGHRVDREVAVTIRYKGDAVATQRLDMLVDGRLVIEVKSRLERPEIGSAQLFNYLRATTLEVGLLFHFGSKPSFKRVVCLNAWGRKGECAVSSSVPMVSPNGKRTDEVDAGESSSGPYVHGANEQDTGNADTAR